MKTRRILRALGVLAVGAFLVGCDTPPPAPGGTVEPLATRFARATLDAAVQIYGTRELQRRAPELIPLFDRDPDGDGPLAKDGLIGLDEIASYPWDDPANVGVILLVAERLLRER